MYGRTGINIVSSQPSPRTLCIVVLDGFVTGGTLPASMYDQKFRTCMCVSCGPKLAAENPMRSIFLSFRYSVSCADSLICFPMSFLPLDKQRTISTVVEATTSYTYPKRHFPGRTITTGAASSNIVARCDWILLSHLYS